jgi:hypothetical protein
MKNSFKFLSSNVSFDFTTNFTLPENKFDQVFFDMIFRRNTYFGNIEFSYLSPLKTHTLRLLNLMIFSGNKMETSKTSTEISQVQMITFQGDKIKLHDATLTKPYLWFELDPAISPLSNQLLLSNLKFRLASPVAIEDLNDPLCHHFISSVCVRPNITSCASNEVFFPGANQCINLDTSVSIDNQRMSIQTRFIEKDYYDVITPDSNILTKSIAIYDSIFDNNNLATINDFLSSSILDKPIPVNELIIILVTAEISVNFNASWFADKFIVYIGSKDTPTDNIFINKKTISSGKDVLLLNFSAAVFIYGADADSTVQFDKVNILWPAQNILDYTINSANTSIKFLSINPGDIMNNAMTIGSPFMGMIRGTSFPLNFLGTSNAYFNYALFLYKAFDVVDLQMEYLGEYYMETENDLVLLKNCPENCLECNSEFGCIDCSPGFYINHGFCEPCAAECVACFNHPQKCMGCTFDNGSIITGNFFHFIFFNFKIFL